MGSSLTTWIGYVLLMTERRKYTWLDRLVGLCLLARGDLGAEMGPRQLINKTEEDEVTWPYKPRAQGKPNDGQGYVKDLIPARRMRGLW